MYTFKEIAALRQQCYEFSFDGREILDKYTNEELQAICNGIGPGFLPAFVRKGINFFNPALQCAAFIHDVEFFESDGTREAFEAANARFLSNGIKAAWNFKWYDLRRWITLFQICRFTFLCRNFGWSSWSENSAPL